MDVSLISMTGYLKSKFFFILGLGLIATKTSYGAIPKSTYVMCRSQKSVRTLRVLESESGCRAIYTKQGIDKLVGEGRFSRSCLQVMSNIKNNLENAKWRCKDVSASAVFDAAN